MEPDRFAAIAQDEQRAVIAVNEEYLRLQDKVPIVVVHDRGQRGRMLAWAIVAMLLVAVVLAWWLLR
jgi:dihydropteroate synthase